MKINVIFFLIVMAGLAVPIHSEYLPLDFYCGRKLSEALQYACENRMMMKRSVPETLPWLPAYKTLNLGRVKRGVVDECCFKPCDMSVLTDYCPPQ